MLLNLTNTRSGGQGRAYRDHAVTEWSVTTRLGRADSTAAVALLLYDAEEQTYIHPPGLQGKSDAVNDGIGEFTDITFSLIRRQLVLHADATRLFRSVPLSNALPVEITGYALVAWPLMGDPLSE